MKILTLLAALLLVAIASQGADLNEFTTTPVDEQAQLDELLLKDGNLLIGRIISQTPDLVVFESDSLGRIEVSRDRIARISGAGDRYGVRTDPDANSIMFCPTPATLDKGDGYFRNYELFFLNFGVGVTDAFDVSLGTMFPVTSDILLLSVGAKYRLLDREEQPIGLALTAAFTKISEYSFSTFGGVAGIGDDRRSLNLTINRSVDDDGDTETLFLIGGDLQAGRSSKIFCEYMSSSSLFDDQDDDLNGFVNLGIRLFGDTHSFSLSGFRPLDEDADSSFLAFPMLMYSKHW